jgi:hypothetical protein
VWKHEGYSNDGQFPEFRTTKYCHITLSKVKDVLVFNTIDKRKHGTKRPLIRDKTGTKDQRNQHTHNATAFVSNKIKKRND